MSLESINPKKGGFNVRSAVGATFVAFLATSVAFELAVAKSPGAQEVRVVKQSSSQREASRLVERARQCNKILESEEAVELASKALKLDSENPWALLVRADAEKAMGNLDRALPDYKLASVSADADAHKLAYRSLGEIYLHFKRYDQSVEVINRLEKESHGLTDGMHECRAKSYAAQGKYVLAAEDLSVAIKSAPRNTRLYIARARVYCSARQWEKALADYNRLIARDSSSGDLFGSNSELYTERAKVYDALGKKSLALSDRNRAKQADSNNYNLAPFRTEKRN